jgi:serine/threonine protein kinase
VTRSCPSCGKVYPDSVFFCGEDGTIAIEDQGEKDVDPRLGKQLGGYVVAARVADGAMGRVFEGRHPQTKARVAIKVLHAEVARDRIAVERFKREYETALELDHRYIVKVLEFGATPDHSHFLTMEYLEGEELSKVLGQGKPMAAARIVRVICQVAIALEHAHSYGFIHRDLKPDNLFLCHTEAGEEVRILDFGSVKLQVDMGAKLTAIGTTLGSPFYMSPEQAMGRSDVDQRTDVFALGAILYEMLTDRIAFDAPNIAKILLRIMHENPHPPSELQPSCPPGLDAVVDKALCKTKEERYASARELASAVIAAYGLSGSVEQWAERPHLEIERALAEVATSAARRAAAEAPARARAGGERGDATAPKVALDNTISEPPVLATGPSFGAMALIAISLLFAGAGLVLLLF